MVISFEKMPGQGSRNLQAKKQIEHLVLTALEVPLSEDDSKGQLKAVLPGAYTAVKVYLLTDIERINDTIPYIKCEIQIIGQSDSTHWPKYFLWIDKADRSTQYGKVSKVAKHPPPPK